MKSEKKKYKQKSAPKTWFEFVLFGARNGGDALRKQAGALVFSQSRERLARGLAPTGVNPHDFTHKHLKLARRRQMLRFATFSQKCLFSLAFSSSHKIL